MGNMGYTQNTNSLQFDGVDDYVSLPGPITNQPTEFTVSSYFNPSVIGSNTIFDHMNSGEWRLGMNLANQEIQGGIHFTPGWIFVTYPLTSLDVNEWKHVTMGFSNDSLFLFIDGVSVDTTVSTFGTLMYENVGDGTGNEFVNIGSRGHTSGGEFFDGKIDEVTVWDYRLNTTEINQYMNCPPTGTETGLVGYWNFEEGIGTTTTDSTINNNDGTLVNGVTWSTDVPVQNCTSLTDTCDYYDTTFVTVYDTTFVTIQDTNTVTVYDTVLVSVTDTLLIDVQLGLTPPNDVNTLKVYPNPSKTDLTIDNGNYTNMSGYSITIVNTLGQTMFTNVINQQTFNIDISSWSGGTYYLNVIDGSSNIVDTRDIVKY